MLLGFAGLTATKGSTSLFTKFVPGPPTVQLANGLRPETSIGPAAANASPPTANAATTVTPAVIQRERRIPHLPRADGRWAISLSLTLVSAWRAQIRSLITPERSASTRGRAGQPRQPSPARRAKSRD